MPVKALVNFFRVPPPAPLIADEATHDRVYRRWSQLAFASVTVGYGFYYTTRLSLSVTKKPLLDSGLVDTTQLGSIGFAMLLAYAVGKAVNGFLGDRVHLSRFFIAGLILSALTNLCFGLSSSFSWFVVLWSINGWFQSLGATTSGVSLTSWFPSGKLGTRYSLWSISHNLGEGLTFVVTAAMVSGLGWRWGFIGPALACIAVALVLLRTLPDRPPSLGLRPPQKEVLPPEALPSVSAVQWEAARNPLVWMIGLASACMYVARYALSNWGVLYLQVEHKYSLMEASSAISMIPIVGALGTLSSGPISDYIFRARRGPSSLFFGGLLVLAMCLLLLVRAPSPLLVRASLGVAGFAIGGQLLFLGGLSAAELCSRRAAGAALGIVGGVSYLGAAVQDYVSGWLLQAGGAVGEPLGFGRVKTFWIGAAVVSVLLTMPLVVRGTKHPDHR